MRSTGELQDIFDDLAGVADRLSEVDVTGLADRAKLDALRDLGPLVWAVQAQVSRLVGAAHETAASNEDGYLGTAGWLKAFLRVGDGHAQVRGARALAAVPEMKALFESGGCGPEHVAALVSVVRDIDPDVLAAGAGKLLAEQAADLAPDDFKRAAVRIRDHFDPAAADRRRRKQQETSWLTANRTLDDVVAVQGMLAPDAGELFLKALGALMPPPSADDPRSASQRRADALADLCRLAGNTAPVAGGEKPHVTVILDLETLRSELAAKVGTLCAGAGCCDGELPKDTAGLFGPDGRWLGATLSSGAPIGPETARRLACDAAIIPMVLGAHSEVLDVGRTKRLVTPAQRRALIVRDGGCRWPGCDRGPEWTDAHHLLAWIFGGPTELWNLLLLCRAHHVNVHEGRFKIRLDHDTGIVSVTYPDGRPYELVSRPRAWRG
jgi:hypothetical protein